MTFKDGLFVPFSLAVAGGGALLALRMFLG